MERRYHSFRRSACAIRGLQPQGADARETALPIAIRCALRTCPNLRRTLAAAADIVVVIDEPPIS